MSVILTILAIPTLGFLDLFLKKHISTPEQCIGQILMLTVIRLGQVIDEIARRRAYLIVGIFYAT